MTRQRARLSGNLLLAAAILSAFVVQAGHLSAEPADTIKIGIISSLDPIGAVWSSSANLGLEKAAAEINQAGGIAGKPVELIFEDDRFDPKNALAAYHKLTTSDRVDLIIGPQFEQTLTALVPLAEKEQRLLITTIASTPLAKAAQPFVIHSVPSDKLVAKCVANAITADGHRSVAFVLPEESYSQTLGRLIEEYLPRGLTTTALNYLPDTSDYKPLLLKLKQSKASAAVFFFVTPEAAITVFNRLKELNIRLPIYSNEALHGSEEFLKKAGALAAGTTYCVVPFDENAGQFKTFFAGLREKPALPLYTLLAYDTLKWLASLIGRYGTDNLVLRNAIYQMNYKGLFGTYRFDEFGDLNFVDVTPYEVTPAGYQPRLRPRSGNS